MRQIVIRPSGVWDSRNPLNDFLKWQEHANRLFNLTTLALIRAHHEALGEPDGPIARRFFHLHRTGRLGQIAWRAYSRADGTGTPRPTFQELSKDLLTSVWHATEHAVISLATVFETYVQCWALNYLLAKLENHSGNEDKEKQKGENAWLPTEAALALRFARVHIDRFTPGFHTITKHLECLSPLLASLPHVQADDFNFTETVIPVSDDLNGLRSIQFWREYRNLLVHGNGVVSVRFHYSHNRFVDKLREFAPKLNPLAIGQRLKLGNDVITTISRTHFHAARAMNEHLSALSKGRRGSAATGVIEAALVREGDHRASLLWSIDETFRRRVRDELVAELTQGRRGPNPRS